LALAVADTVDSGAASAISARPNVLGPRLLEEAEQRVEHDDAGDDDGFVGQGGLARVLQQPLRHRDDGGHEQDDHQESSGTARAAAPTTGSSGALLSRFGPYCSRRRAPRLGSTARQVEPTPHHGLRRLAMSRARRLPASAASLSPTVPPQRSSTSGAGSR
jgi:hypothetical protein